MQKETSSRSSPSSLRLQMTTLRDVSDRAPAELEPPKTKSQLHDAEFLPVPYGQADVVIRQTAERAPDSGERSANQMREALPHSLHSLSISERLNR